uniref:Uncharacterized protein n=1 Tax=Chaetoceros debilis TaxID=122233 RepID=A0A7S3VGJ5_9STRA|mmetsp:Transcript_11091/g.16807  ORF Transcript_11091/g.16807 Transcript_11091/m.16807 type:complete len:273 (+) Transcript_11091:98-916(+)
MNGTHVIQNRPMYRGKSFKDGNLPKTSKKSPKTKSTTNKYIDLAKKVTSKGNGQDLQDLESVEQVEAVEVIDEDTSVIREVKHVQKRIKNVRESIQLSSSLSQPSLWNDNCLSAVKNCVNEWRSIVYYHGDQTREREKIGEDYNEETCELLPDDEWSKSTALQIFNLIQMALQTGPLSGGKPGYFKRCGADVAGLAKEFLKSVIGNAIILDASSLEKELRFSTNQKESIEKWMRDAEKAVVANKSPSKSALKLQSQAVGKNSKKKNKKGNRR